MQTWLPGVARQGSPRTKRGETTGPKPIQRPDRGFQTCPIKFETAGRAQGAGGTNNIALALGHYHSGVEMVWPCHRGSREETCEGTAKLPGDGDPHHAD